MSGSVKNKRLFFLIKSALYGEEVQGGRGGGGAPFNNINRMCSSMGSRFLAKCDWYVRGKPGLIELKRI
jgi:hypothetical protein